MSNIFTLNQSFVNTYNVSAINRIVLTIVDGVNWNHVIFHKEYSKLNLPNLELQIMIDGVLLYSDNFEVREELVLRKNLPYRIDFTLFNTTTIIHRFADEISFLSNDCHSLISKSLDSQVVKDQDIFLSHHRFINFLEDSGFRDIIAGANVLVSGCSSGNECYVISALGAKSVIGIDPDDSALSIGKIRYSEISNISFYKSIDEIPSTERLNLIISRHVLEHIPESQRMEYISEISNLLDDSAIVFFEFPNQNCIIEPHTNIFFFHQFSLERQLEILDSMRHGCGGFIYKDDDYINVLERLVGHKNINIEDFFSILPSNLDVLKVIYLDFNRHIVNNLMAPTIQCYLSKR